MTRTLEYTHGQFRCGAKWVVFRDGDAHGWLEWRDGKREPLKDHDIERAELLVKAGTWRETTNDQ